MKVKTDKMKIRIFIISLLVSWACLAQAQEIAYPDVVFTKTGDIFKGKIQEYKQGEYVLFEMETGDVIRIKADNLRKIKQKKLSPYAFKEKGYYFHFNLGLQGRYKYNEGDVVQAYPALVAELHSGYQFHRLLGVGLGVGATRYSQYLRDLQVFPITLDIRSYFVKANRTPFGALSVGYGIPKLLDKTMVSEVKGGLYINPTFGVRFGSKKGAFTLEVGQKIQKVEERLIEKPTGWGWGHENLKTVDLMTFYRTEFKIGWLF